MRVVALRIAFVCSVAAAWCAIAEANGRPPATSTITFQQGNSQHIVAGMTFGALFSSDGGHTWTWICEAAFPYSGVYDPNFVETQSGALFATTLQGLRVSRDGCSFSLAPVVGGGRCDGPKSDPCFSRLFLSNVVAGSGAIYATASSPYDSLIYRSGDDGHTFEVLSAPAAADEYWQSFVIAPSNPKRLYLSGYRFTTQCDGHATNVGSACRLNANCTGSGTGSAAPKCTTVKVLSMFRSDDGGASWSPMSQAKLVVSQSSTISIVGVDPSDANQVYIHVGLESGATGDAVYKSANGGGAGSGDQSAWVKIFDSNDPRGLVVLVRSNGGLVAATETSGAFSSAGGTACVDQTSCNWTPLSKPPHINCLAEEPDTKDIWACTQNYGNGSNITGDGAGIMKTSDLATWTPMLKFADISAPVTCGSDLSPAQECVAPYDGLPSAWCCLVQQLGITSNAVACTGAYACKQGGAALSGSAAGSRASSTTTKRGCCDTGESGAGAALLGALTLLFVYRRRRA